MLLIKSFFFLFLFLLALLFFGGAGVYQDHYFNTNNSYQWELSSNKGSFDGFEEDFELVGGTKNFTVNEVEVFKVEYINN